MNVEIGIVATQFLFRENLFRIFGIVLCSAVIYSPCPVPKIYLLCHSERKNTRAYRAILYWIESGCRREVLLEKIYAAFRGNRREGGGGLFMPTIGLSERLNGWDLYSISTVYLVWVFGTNKQLQNCAYFSSFFASSTKLQSQSKAFRKKLS
jgi:hypothetical protein